MVEDYHVIRARELGLLEGTGKRYSSEDLNVLATDVEKLYPSAFAKSHTEVEAGIAAYLESFKDYNIYKGSFDIQGLTRFWAEAVGSEAVTTPERLFYLGVDILRIRLGPNWLGKIRKHNENLTATDRFRWYEIVWDDEKKEEVVKDFYPVTTYSLFFYTQILPPFSNFLSITASGEKFTDEHIEVRRKLLTGNISWELDFYNQWFDFSLGYPRVMRPYSPLYGPELNEDNWRAFSVFNIKFHELSLAPQELQRFGKRLWQAHCNTSTLKASA